MPLVPPAAAVADRVVGCPASVCAASCASAPCCSWLLLLLLLLLLPASCFLLPAAAALLPLPLLLFALLPSPLLPPPLAACRRVLANGGRCCSPLAAVRAARMASVATRAHPATTAFLEGLLVPPCRPRPPGTERRTAELRRKSLSRNFFSFRQELVSHCAGTFQVSHGCLEFRNEPQGSSRTVRLRQECLASQRSFKFRNEL
jgi:hypothetical protein